MSCVCGQVDAGVLFYSQETTAEKKEKKQIAQGSCFYFYFFGLYTKMEREGRALGERREMTN